MLIRLINLKCFHYIADFFSLLYILRRREITTGLTGKPPSSFLTVTIIIGQ